MAYQRKYATTEELRAARSSAGRKGAEATRRNGSHGGGRPRGTNVDTVPVSTCTIRMADKAYLDAMSKSLHLSKAACIRVLVLIHRMYFSTFDEGAWVGSMLDESMCELEKFTKFRGEQ